MSKNGERDVLRQLNRALKALTLSDTDGAAVELARTYARAIDNYPDDARRYGPLLLAVLESLGMTPRARAALTKGGARDTATSPLDELRQRRATRINDAAPVDTPAS